MEETFRSGLGKRRILELYDQKLNELAIDYRYENVKTSFGATNIIVTGKSTNPPLFIIHGANGCAPIGLEAYPNLSSKFQVFAIDVLAQPNKSAQTRMSMKDNTYGQWINELIDVLQLQDVTLVGFSFSGLVILKTLLYKEERIRAVYLAAPAYIVNGNPFKALFKIFVPMKMYMRTQKPKFIERFLAEVFTDRDEFAIKCLSAVFLHFKMDFSPVPVISSTQAIMITTTITLFAAKHDIMFPGEKMIKRAKKIFPSMQEAILLGNSKHVQSRADNEAIESRILRDM